MYITSVASVLNNASRHVLLGRDREVEIGIELGLGGVVIAPRTLCMRLHE